MNFDSDNQSGVSSKILESLVSACSGSAPSYGTDDWTRRAESALGQVFGRDVRAFFVATGTAANCLALSTVANPWDAILCHRQAHIAIDELSAPEFFTGGARLLPLETDSGKISAKDLHESLDTIPAQRPHNVRVSALSVSQATENGLIYRQAELVQLADAAHQRGMHVHMDGARFANAVAALACEPADITWKAGIDVLSLGASKNGALAAEAVIIFDNALAKDFELRRKRAGQLVSKGRLFGAQFVSWLQDDHWIEMARNANETAQYLSAALRTHDGIKLTWPVEANEVFVVMKQDLLARLKAGGVRCSGWYRRSVPQSAYMSDDELPVRFVTSWSTTRSEVDAVAELLHQLT